MKEHSLLCSASMVNGILAGRQTQTRLILKPQPRLWTAVGGHAQSVMWPVQARRSRIVPMKCPLGSLGDHLWVQEKWMRVGFDARVSNQMLIRFEDGTEKWMEASTSEDLFTAPEWQEAHQMPRWASRIMLEIKELRAERVQAITEEDAQAEGEEGECLDCGETPCHPACLGRQPDYIAGFRDHWIERHGAESWTTNPWVWVLTFAKVK